MKHRVLLIDDEPSIGRSLRRVLSDEGHDFEVATSGAQGVAALTAFRPQVVLLDLRLPDGNGLDFLDRIRELDRSAQVILITAYGDTKAAVRAMKAGASDFLRKPYELDELLLAIDTAAKTYAREAELTVYRQQGQHRYKDSEVIFGSSCMTQVWDVVRKSARSDAASVLITGESGTGKELVARALHFESPRRNAPFVELNCSTFQESLAENELFGHERGAFTGANQVKRGLVEVSEGGTLFLDEIGEMPMSAQAKLLRFLEDRAFRRVGGNSDIEVDLRILAATNVDLERRIAEERFRMDLLFRLKLLVVHLPPLRERGDDVILLAEHFLRRLSLKLRKNFCAIDDEVREAFLAYHWPGNVRELKNVIERVVLIEDGERLTMRHVPPEVASARRVVWPAAPSAVLPTAAPGAVDDPESLPTLRDIEDAHITRVLAACEGNKSRAARVLGLSRQGLLDRLKRLDTAVSGDFAVKTLGMYE
ncbi:MAG: sigma-54-dependent Fis family transcriptional regulator [Candidatus Eisenbacteria bacterium]|nr:sigma-54-dependent Fis family transcriptional regulator [Candidatus Eisenbacteria bacterium]